MNRCDVARSKPIRSMKLAAALVFALSCAGCAVPCSCLDRPAGDKTTVADALARSDAATARQARSLAAIAVARDVVARNLAGADTTAFKRVTSTVAPDGRITIGLDMEQGSLDRTERSLDVGIEGHGFLAVKDERAEGGVAYTRNGNLFVDKAGTLVLGTEQSPTLVPSIQIPPSSTEITIAQDGAISVLVSGSTTKRTVGRLKLWRFPNPSHLKPLPDGNYGATAASGAAVVARTGTDGDGSVLQGFLERSNVDVNRERKRIEFLDEWKAAILATAHPTADTASPAGKN